MTRAQHSAQPGEGKPVRVAIRVKPGAGRTRVGGTYGGDGSGSADGAIGDGGVSAGALIVAVAQRAVDGKATEAALRALAEALGVPRRKVSLVTGLTSRDKVVEIEDPPDGLNARLSVLRTGADG